MSTVDAVEEVGTCPFHATPEAAPISLPRAAFRPLRRDPLAVFAELRRTQGDVAIARLRGRTLVLVSHPDDVKRVLVSNARAYVREVTTVTSSRREGWFPARPGFIGNSDPSVHVRARRALQPAFSKARIEGFWSHFVATAEEGVSEWRDGETIDVSAAMQRLLLTMTAKVTFGRPIGIETGELMRRLDGFLTLDLRFRTPLRDALDKLRLIKLVRLALAHDGVLSAIDELFAEKQAAGGGGDDMIAILLRQADVEGLDSHARAMEAFGLLFADHDSTATMATWALHELSRRPDVHARVREEARDLAAGPELPYTDAVLRETIRLYPASWGIARGALEADVLGDRRIPAGASVWASPFLIHRDERWWTDAERFVPERWLDGSQRGRPEHAYFPFGAGPHKCIGSTLAWQELLATVATVARDVQLSSVSSGEVVPVARTSIKPRDRLRLRVERA
jgi:cytochrome P450